jgi:hypothetical protein
MAPSQDYLHPSRRQASLIEIQVKCWLFPGIPEPWEQLEGPRCPLNHFLISNGTVGGSNFGYCLNTTCLRSTRPTGFRRCCLESPDRGNFQIFSKSLAAIGDKEGDLATCGAAERAQGGRGLTPEGIGADPGMQMGLVGERLECRLPC